ncbi:hypothetical protein CPB83DRAFT_562762 [Crepidotus variabilis]|uniref:Steroid 5-alpha reductase C-terminal domain-containing protein n=1 Tax=Crepidotus variabilis TaxID=179855 RepID=A0A9P6E9Y3_9AGAR|nr:hypothetical protein CPB83DRAFT_562762 [Crepidotus variabilis]
MSSTSKKPYDAFARGQTGSSPLTTFIFCAERALDPIIQYQILANGLGSSILSKLGLELIPDGPPTQIGVPLVDNLGLSPYRLLLLAMAAGGALKQIIWAVHLNREPLYISSAIYGPIFNTVVNGTNDLLATTAFFSGGVAGRLPAVFLGVALYIFGIITETVSEFQRKAFKDNSKNDGKVYTGGLWSITRHINYTGYTSWRVGYSLAAGNWYFGVPALSFWSYGFVTNAIPILDAYCSKKYGAQWEDFKQKTPYRFIPGIW